MAGQGQNSAEFGASLVKRSISRGQISRAKNKQDVKKKKTKEAKRATK